MFTAEGGTFTAGSLNEDNVTNTGAQLNGLWDGTPVKRIRAAGDPISILVGRRLAMHIMVQPGAEKNFLSNSSLKTQGLLARVLVAWPQSRAGTRPYQDANLEDDAAIKTYGVKLLSLLETPAALATGKSNELDTPALPLSVAATDVFIKLYNHIEPQIKGKLGNIKEFACKAAEQAARIAGILEILRKC